MPRRSSRLAAKNGVHDPMIVLEPSVGVSTIYLEPIPETSETHDSHYTVIENIIESPPSPPLPPSPPPTPTPRPVVEQTVTPNVQQQVNSEVAVRIHMFNRNIDTLTSKITDLTVALDELKKKKEKRRGYCSLM